MAIAASARQGTRRRQTPAEGGRLPRCMVWPSGWVGRVWQLPSPLQENHWCRGSRKVNRMVTPPRGIQGHRRQRQILWEVPAVQEIDTGTRLLGQTEGSRVRTNVTQTISANSKAASPVSSDPDPCDRKFETVISTLIPHLSTPLARCHVHVRNGRSADRMIQTDVRHHSNSAAYSLRLVPRLGAGAGSGARDALQPAAPWHQVSSLPRCVSPQPPPSVNQSCPSPHSRRLPVISMPSSPGELLQAPPCPFVPPCSGWDGPMIPAASPPCLHHAHPVLRVGTV